MKAKLNVFPGPNPQPLDFKVCNKCVLSVESERDLNSAFSFVIPERTAWLSLVLSAVYAF